MATTFAHRKQETRGGSAPADGGVEERSRAVSTPRGCPAQAPTCGSSNVGAVIRLTRFVVGREA